LDTLESCVGAAKRACHTMMCPVKRSVTDLLVCARDFPIEFNSSKVK
jgi:hypothetical protein